MNECSPASLPFLSQAAWFVSKQVKELNVSNVFLATNGNHDEVSMYSYGRWFFRSDALQL